MAEARRRTFGPVVLVGLASAGLAAVAGNRAWVEWAAEGTASGSQLTIAGDDTATVPLAGALALVLLACWGVVLVTRGRVRRAVAGLGLVASLGMVATAVLGVRSAADALRERLAELGVADLSTQSSPWFWVYLACTVVCVVAAALAVRLTPSWPEMGSRYDAPGAAHPESSPDANGIDLWRALDEGRDPTLTDRKPTDP